METYVGLDVSLKTTSVCVVDREGTVVKEGVVVSEPEAIAAFIAAHAPGVKRVGLESGPTSTWLWRELDRHAIPVICIDARHASAALSMQVNKSDRNDALGLARIMQTGWYRQVQVKSEDSHTIRALLASRALLINTKRTLENHLRGVLKNTGLVIGRAKGGTYSVRVRELLANEPELAAIVRPLLETRTMIDAQLLAMDKLVRGFVKARQQVRAFMSVPGVGPITALAYLATIDDPTRFKRSRTVGAYCGLTSRRYASGEVDWSGRISKCGDSLLRSYLFEAASALLTRTKRGCALKTWGLKLAQRTCMKKAKTAVARKLAVLLHRMWCDGTEFRWDVGTARA